MSWVKNAVWYLLGEKNFKKNPQSRKLVPLKALGILFNISDGHPHPCYVGFPPPPETVYSNSWV